MANNENIIIDPVYTHELKRVYKEIDKFSNLLTPMRESSELIWNTSRRSKRQKTSSSTKDDTLTSKSKKSSTDKEGEQANWQDDTNAQLGYGEITSVSHTSDNHFDR